MTTLTQLEQEAAEAVLESVEHLTATYADTMLASRCRRQTPQCVINEAELDCIADSALYLAQAVVKRITKLQDIKVEFKTPNLN